VKPLLRGYRGKGDKGSPTIGAHGRDYGGENPAFEKCCGGAQILKLARGGLL